MKVRAEIIIDAPNDSYEEAVKQAGSKDKLDGMFLVVMELLMHELNDIAADTDSHNNDLTFKCTDVEVLEDD